jgi:hypothetical protein
MLGTGAILDQLGSSCSPEAQLARDAYRSVGRELDSFVRLSVSGRELVNSGFPGDVDLAVDQDVSGSTPILLSEQDFAANWYFVGANFENKADRVKSRSLMAISEFLAGARRVDDNKPQRRQPGEKSPTLSRTDVVGMATAGLTTQSGQKVHPQAF